MNERKRGQIRHPISDLGVTLMKTNIIIALSIITFAAGCASHSRDATESTLSLRTAKAMWVSRLSMAFWSFVKSTLRFSAPPQQTHSSRLGGTAGFLRLCQSTLRITNICRVLFFARPGTRIASLVLFQRGAGSIRMSPLYDPLSRPSLRAKAPSLRRYTT